MTRLRAITLLLVGVALGAVGGSVGTLWARRDLVAIPVAFNSGTYPCPGPYPGTVRVENDKVIVRVRKLQRDGLDLYQTHKPLTGGDRLLVYFDLDGSKGAEYALMIYRDEWTLRKGSRPGMVDVEVGTGQVQDLGPVSGVGAQVEISTRLIEGRIRKAWHHRM